MKKDIKQIIAEGESQQTEFKSSFNVEAMESITAFANTEGGCVLVGISKLATELATNLSQLVTDLSVQVKTLIINLNKQYLSFEGLKHATELATKVATSSRQYFRRVFLAPAFKEGFIDLLYPDKPNHPKQKYYLTEKGKEVLKALEA